MVPCTMSAPRSTATMELATAQPASLWVWMPTLQTAPTSSPTRSTTCATCGGQSGSVGVAQTDRLRPGLRGRPQAGQGVVGMGGVGVEEVLRVVEDPLPLAPQEGHRLGDHAQVLVAVYPEDLLQVEVPGLAHDGRNRSPALGQCAQLDVVLGRHPPSPGHAEGRHHRPAELHLLQRAEELLILGVGTGKTTLDHVDAEVGDPGGDADLLVRGDAQPLALHAVAQRGVVQE